jgi:uncharacterized protein (TIGR02246 family)
MKKLFIAPLLMLMLLSLACSPAPQESATPPASPSADADMSTAQVRESSEVRVKALETGDVEGYLSVYADEAVWMPPSANEIVGKEAARKRITQAFEAASLEGVYESQEQTVMSPEWISDHGKYSIMVTPKRGGQTKQEVGHFLTLWRREKDGKWRIYYDIWNTNNPVVDIDEAK